MIKERSYSLFDQTFSFKTAKNAQFFSNTRYLFTLKKKNANFVCFKEMK